MYTLPYARDRNKNEGLCFLIILIFISPTVIDLFPKKKL